MTITFFIIKTLHVVAATAFFGAGLASAFYKVRADREGNLPAIVFAQRGIVLADWIFTVPSGIVLPATGIWMALETGRSLTGGFIAWGIGLYLFAGICWVPAALLQIRMRNDATRALENDEPLPPRYRRDCWVWFLLGIPAFVAALLTLFVMVAKAGLDQLHLFPFS